MASAKGKIGKPVQTPADVLKKVNEVRRVVVDEVEKEDDVCDRIDVLEECARCVLRGRVARARQYARSAFSKSR